LSQFWKAKIIAKKYHKYYVLSKAEEKQQPAPHEQEEHSRPQPELYPDLSKEIMTIKAQLLAVVNRLDY
jgi:hypothetical protein